MLVIQVMGALFATAYSPAWFQMFTKLSCRTSSAQSSLRNIRSATPNSFAEVKR